MAIAAKSKKWQNSIFLYINHQSSNVGIDAASEQQAFCLPHLNAGEPLPDGGEALLSCDVVHHNHAIGLAKKLLGDASIPAAGSR